MTVKQIKPTSEYPIKRPTGPALLNAEPEPMIRPLPTAPPIAIMLHCVAISWDLEQGVV